MVKPLPASALRWRCLSETLQFETTNEMDAMAGLVGQTAGLEALRFGVECDARGQNVFVRGLAGTGRLALVSRILEEMQPPEKPQQDRCFVHNFSEPHRPRLITLPAGRARDFRRRVQELAQFIEEGLGEALNADPIRARREAIQNREKEEITALTEPFEKALAEAELQLVTLQQGPVAQPAIFPVIGGDPVPPPELERLRAGGEVSEEEHAAILQRIEDHQRALGEITHEVRKLRRRTAEDLREVMEQEGRKVLQDMAGLILEPYGGEDVQRFNQELIEDALERHATGDHGDEDQQRFYEVNVVRENEPGSTTAPVEVVNIPTLANLLGLVEREWGPQGPGPSDYRMIRGGSILNADGGYLILDARDVLTEGGAWRTLVHTLRSGCLEIVPSDVGMFTYQNLKPEPIPVQLRVILVGDPMTYYALDHYDPDFGALFKVLADFDNVIDREPHGETQYAGVLARIAAEENLLPFHRSAVATLVEHGARIASRRGKLTARFGRIADIAREAAFLAKQTEQDKVSGEDVKEAIRRTKARADLPSRRFRELMRDGTIQVQTRDPVVGQVNGLAVIHAGPITYGFPARITATIGAGSAGLVSIEGRAQLSGAIHTKGFHILSGLLRHLLQTDHPLAFSASVAFEQSYGGIDGDSASGAEICCLLSALTGVPIQQNIAITGAVDQQGHLEAIGGANEKIEGFFDACQDAGLTGAQGVIIPRTNAGDLMLRQDVVDAAESGQFHVWAVDTVHQALEVLTGMPAGERSDDGSYPEGTLLQLAVDKAREYWMKSVQRPPGPREEEEEEEGKGKGKEGEETN